MHNRGRFEMTNQALVLSGDPQFLFPEETPGAVLGWVTNNETLESLVQSLCCDQETWDVSWIFKE